MQQKPTINTQTDGNGPAVILAHGWAASQMDWDAQKPALATHGFRFYALDHLGHGESAKPSSAGDASIDHVYTAFCAWVAGLQIDAPFGLIGHSMGGYISLHYASEFPERVGALGLIDPLIAPEQMTLPLWLMFSQPRLLAGILRWTPVQWFETIYRFTPHRQIPLSKRLSVARDYKHASPFIAYFLHNIPSLENRLKLIKAPTLLIYGEHDLSLKPHLFPVYARQIPNLAAMHCLKKTRHTPHVEQAAFVNQETVSFLKKYLKGP